MTKRVKPHQVRAAAFLAELEKAAQEYREAHNVFEVARQRFEIAKERLAAIRRRAPDVLDRFVFGDWQYHNEDLWAVGAEIGDAILSELRARAVEAAGKSIDSNGKVPWDPAATAAQIVTALDEHGFEWRTGTPRREVHAALLHLKGITKTKDGRFVHGEAQEIYTEMKDGSGFPFASTSASGEKK